MSGAPSRAGPNGAAGTRIESATPAGRYGERRLPDRNSADRLRAVCADKPRTKNDSGRYHARDIPLDRPCSTAHGPRPRRRACRRARLWAAQRHFDPPATQWAADPDVRLSRRRGTADSAAPPTHPAGAGELKGNGPGVLGFTTARRLPDHPGGMRSAEAVGRRTGSVRPGCCSCRSTPSATRRPHGEYAQAFLGPLAREPRLRAGALRKSLAGFAKVPRRGIPTISTRSTTALDGGVDRSRCRRSSDTDPRRSPRHGSATGLQREPGDNLTTC